jgi:Ni/Fe-hydrogenase subunit HybB-like protein
VLAVFVAAGTAAYAIQLRDGLVATALDNHVPWGIYIANFTFLDGIAASAALIYILAFVFDRREARRVALLGSGIAISACVACMLFVVVDIGRPLAAWHLVPGLGSLNWPVSMLAWDVVALNGYLAINTLGATYVVYCIWRGREPRWRIVVPAIYLAIFWAILIQAVIAFLYSANVGRPFWHSGLLGPRFLASSFSAGSALMILAFSWIGRHTNWRVERALFDRLALIAAIAVQANVFMLAMELFTELYHPTSHSASARYAFVGLHGHYALVPWVWTSIALQIVSMVLLMFHRTRRQLGSLTVACLLAIIGVWIDKGMGLVVPGFTPTSLGVIREYHPNAIEILVTLGIWALAIMIFSGLAKAGLHILGFEGEPIAGGYTSEPPPAPVPAGVALRDV